MKRVREETRKGYVLIKRSQKCVFLVAGSKMTKKGGGKNRS